MFAQPDFGASAKGLALPAHTLYVMCRQGQNLRRGPQVMLDEVLWLSRDRLRSCRSYKA